MLTTKILPDVMFPDQMIDQSPSADTFFVAVGNHALEGPLNHACEWVLWRVCHVPVFAVLQMALHVAQRLDNIAADIVGRARE